MFHPCLSTSESMRCALLFLTALLLLFCSFSEMIIDQCVHCNRFLRLQSHGVLSNGSSYTSPNLANQEESRFIGLPLDQEIFEVQISPKNSTQSVGEGNEEFHWWVKTKLDDETYIVSASRGFDVWNSVARRRNRSKYKKS